MFDAFNRLLSFTLAFVRIQIIFESGVAQFLDLCKHGIWDYEDEQ